MSIGTGIGSRPKIDGLALPPVGSRCLLALFLSIHCYCFKGLLLFNCFVSSRVPLLDWCSCFPVVAFFVFIFVCFVF